MVVLLWLYGLPIRNMCCVHCTPPICINKKLKMTFTLQSNRYKFVGATEVPSLPLQISASRTKTATLKVRTVSLVIITEMKDKRFNKKKRWFHQRCKRMQSARRKSSTMIDMMAVSLLEDSVDTILQISPEELHATWVFWIGNNSVANRDWFDQEWFTLVTKYICELNRGLWRNGCKLPDEICLHIYH